MQKDMHALSENDYNLHFHIPNVFPSHVPCSTLRCTSGSSKHLLPTGLAAQCSCFRLVKRSLWTNGDVCWFVFDGFYGFVWPFGVLWVSYLVWFLWDGFMDLLFGFLRSFLFCVSLFEEFMTYERMSYLVYVSSKGRCFLFLRLWMFLFFLPTNRPFEHISFSHLTHP